MAPTLALRSLLGNGVLAALADLVGAFDTGFLGCAVDFLPRAGLGALTDLAAPSPRGLTPLVRNFASGKTCLVATAALARLGADLAGDFAAALCVLGVGIGVLALAFNSCLLAARWSSIPGAHPWLARP